MGNQWLPWKQQYSLMECHILIIESQYTEKYTMLYWFCYRTALVVEDIVRSHSVVPATIGVIDGKIHVGMLFVDVVKYLYFKQV